MRCKIVCEQLNRLSDGERLPDVRRYLEVGWHCLSCVPCRATWRLLRQLRYSARHLTLPPPPAALKARLFTALPDLPPIHLLPESYKPETRKNAFPLTHRLIGGIVVTGVLCVGLLALPRSHGKLGLAAQVRVALQSINIYHLKGWKILDGKRVPWEVWRRQRPYLYMERLGGDVTFDDGQQRLRLIRANRTLGRARDILLRTAAQPDPGRVNAGTVTGEEMLQTSCFDPAWWRDNRKPTSETPDTLVFKESNGSSTTVDKHLFLPVQIEIAPVDGTVREWASFVQAKTAQFLRAEYDVPLPPSIARFRWPQAAQLIDCVDGFSPPSIPRENSVRKNGVTIHATPLQMDTQGNVLIAVRAWLGNVPINMTPSDLGIGMNVNIEPSVGTNAIDPPATYDERGHGYICSGVRGSPREQGIQLLRLIPVEPLAMEAPLPHTLTLAMYVSPAIFVKEPGEKLMFGRNLYREQMILTLPLPQPSREIDMTRYLKSDSDAERYLVADGHIVTERRPVKCTDAESRAKYYRDGFDARETSGPHRAKLLRAIFWQEKALSLVAPHTNWAQRLRLNLASDYYDALDKEHVQELCNEIIAECDNNPDLIKGTRENAENSLRSWMASLDRISLRHHDQR
jgi:hypothetical protein